MRGVATAFLFASTAALAAASSDTTTITAGPSPTQVQKAVKRAEESALPLTEYKYSFSEIPYQVNPFNSGRGPQSGFNICNDTTAAVVAYCTNDKHGSRVIPAGAITGLQVMHTSQYLQFTGHINMTAIGLTADDTGGELDPHGADFAGNPLGGLVYSNNLPSGDNSTLAQVVEWNNFIGSGTFCFKLCDPSATDNYCQNKFDLLGCSYNMPAAYEDDVFLECNGDLQDVVGTYTGSDGKTSTWSQPESLAGTETLPWTPRIPASSNCVTYSSTDLFPATALGYQSTSAPSATSGGDSSGSKTGTAASQAAKTGSSSATGGDNGASDMVAVSVTLSALTLFVGSVLVLA
ncbi:hypothetical protein JCM11251_000362 [Rhodosporidiobolus azoricus]